MGGDGAALGGSSSGSGVPSEPRIVGGKSAGLEPPASSSTGTEGASPAVLEPLASTALLGETLSGEAPQNKVASERTGTVGEARSPDDEVQDIEEQAAYMEITVVGVLILIVIAIVIPIAFAVWFYLASSSSSSSSTPAAADNEEEDFLIPQQEETVNANDAEDFLIPQQEETVTANDAYENIADVENIASSSVHQDAAPGGTAVVDGSAGGAFEGSADDGRVGNAGGVVVGPSAY
ncbi:unnamed protein product [Amoebophrya sp. A25]|nr:unnamed protein product [Amoebophrya sp. A25]|eukprot:GSA25T00010685001.1